MAPPSAELYIIRTLLVLVTSLDTIRYAWPDRVPPTQRNLSNIDLKIFLVPVYTTAWNLLKFIVE